MDPTHSQSELTGLTGYERKLLVDEMQCYVLMYSPDGIWLSVESKAQILFKYNG